MDFLRTFWERGNSQTIKSRGMPSGLQTHYKTQESTIEKFTFKATRLGSIKKTKSIGGSKETWNQKCHKAQKETTHYRN